METNCVAIRNEKRWKTRQDRTTQYEAARQAANGACKGQEAEEKREAAAIGASRAVSRKRREARIRIDSLLKAIAEVALRDEPLGGGSTRLRDV